MTFDAFLHNLVYLLRLEKEIFMLKKIKNLKKQPFNKSTLLEID